MDAQRTVAAFLDAHDLRTDPTYRLLDLASEVGELAKDVTESTDYGTTPEAARLSEDELGDALFCILALAEESGHDADDALETALAKYKTRLGHGETPSSGSHDD